MAQVNQNPAGGIHLDSMIRVEPFDIFDGREGEAKTKNFFNDVTKFMNSRNIPNKEIVKEIVPYLRGRAEILFQLAKAKRRYAEYDVAYWNPVPARAAVQEVRDEQGVVTTPAVQEQPEIPKTLRTMFEDLLIKEVNEDTIRNKIKATGKQLQGEPFVEFADRVRLLVFQLHSYTYTDAQRALDQGHTKEFQEALVLIRDGAYPKLWDFLVSQGHIDESVRTEATFQAAIEGSKVWEASNEGRAFLASRPRAQHAGFSGGPVVPTLAQPIGAVALKGKGNNKKKRKRKDKKTGQQRKNQQPGQQPDQPTEAQNKQLIVHNQVCKYCGIKNHAVSTCRRKAADVARGIHKDKCDGYPITPYYLMRQQGAAAIAPAEQQQTSQPVAAFNQSYQPAAAFNLSPQPVTAFNLSSQEWEQWAQGQIPPQIQHANLQGNMCYANTRP